MPAIDPNSLPKDIDLLQKIVVELCVRITMMSISHSDLMPIRTERSDAGLSQCEIVIDISQEFRWFSLPGFIGNSLLAVFVFGR